MGRNPSFTLWLSCAVESAFDWMELRLAKLDNNRRRQKEQKRRKQVLQEELKFIFEKKHKDSDLSLAKTVK